MKPRYLACLGRTLELELIRNKMILKGISASQGKIKGIARVVVSLDNIGAFKPGDILVTKATSPMWTPFIHASSAVVTELGGTLSHAAIVSREYGKPAVVGVKNATELIKDGQKIEVDGSNGEVSS